MLFNTTVSEYLSSLMDYFFRKGKRNKVESKFYLYVLNTMERKHKNLYAILKKTHLKTSSYIRLVERRRGKYSKYRIRFLKKSVGIQRGLVLVGRSAYTYTKKSPRQFSTLLTQELSNWSLGKHTFKKKYKEVHVLAKRHFPRKWSRKHKNIYYIKKRWAKRDNKNIVVQALVKPNFIKQKSKTTQLSLPLVNRLQKTNKLSKNKLSSNNIKMNNLKTLKRNKIVNAKLLYQTKF